MNKIVVIYFFFGSLCSYAQKQNNLNVALEHLLYNRVEEAKSTIVKVQNSKKKKLLEWHISAFNEGIKDSLYISSSDSLITFNKVMELLKEGLIYDEKFINKDSLIFQRYKQALKVSTQSEDSLLVKFTLNKILKFTFGNRESFSLLDNYITIFKNYVDNQEDQAIHDYYKYSSISYITNTPYIEKYKDALSSIENSDNNLLKGLLNQMLGVQESHFNRNDELGISYFKTAAKLYKKVPGVAGERSLFGIYNNLGVAYNRKSNPKIALDYFQKALNHKIPKNSLLQKSYLYLAIAETYKNLKNLDSTYYYLSKEKETLNTFKEFENALKLQDIEIKYKTAEKEKQILIEKQKNKQNRNVALSLAGIILAGSIIFFLIQKNTTKKRQLAEQETLIEQQKVATLLKEQELTSIDAMIAGQEKERQKVANELHDDLGSLMATVKLHFDNVKVDEKDPAMQNAQALLEKAYQKIRGMAHAKNSGVMANHGLLPAVKKMAKTINDTNALEVNVEDFGLAERMENSLELTIFRILQELITNIIKHAEATKANIQFTQHEDKLNIIVEDNGKGFDMPSVARSANGMGLGTIEKRIEHLEGSFTVDSIIGKGTSILIDIPV